MGYVDDITLVYNGVSYQLQKLRGDLRQGMEQIEKLPGVVILGARN
jgi:hypothetical protein